MKIAKPFPLTPNTGGVIKIKHIVGREKIIEEFWEILQGRGISLFAERRFGKSSLLRKMAHNPTEGFVVLYKSVMGISKIVDMIETIYLDACEKKLLNRRAKSRLDKNWHNITSRFPKVLGVEFGQIDHMWQKKLIALSVYLILSTGYLIY